jgi:deazaflavin-dependent oxidoreductase (nitroreductase family)
MSETPTATRMRRRARIMRGVNVLMRRLLRLPFPTPLNRRLMLLTFTGRKSGRIYRQPVSYVPDGDTLLTPGGGRWTRNLRADQPIRITLRGRNVRAVPEIIQNPPEIGRLLQKMLVANPRLTSFVPFVRPGEQIDEAQLTAAVGHGFRIIRWHLDEPDRTSGGADATRAPVGQ